MWAQAFPLTAWWVLAISARLVEHRRMLPDPGCYEERYRMTAAALPRHLAIGLISIGLLFLVVAPWVTGAVIAAALVILIGTGVAAHRMIAFRADQAGITLGVEPGRLMVRRRPAVFIPWADAEKIIFYPARPGKRVPKTGSRASESSSGRGLRPCPGVTSRLPGARCPAWRPGRPARLPAGGWTASDSPPSQPRWRREFPLSTSASAPAWALRGRVQGQAPLSWGPQIKRVQQLSDRV